METFRWGLRPLLQLVLWIEVRWSSQPTVSSDARQLQVSTGRKVLIRFQKRMGVGGRFARKVTSTEAFVVARYDGIAIAPPAVAALKCTVSVQDARADPRKVRSQLAAGEPGTVSFSISFAPLSFAGLRVIARPHLNSIVGLLTCAK